MACLLCQWFQPAEPVEHRIARETDSCEQHCGRSWNQSTAIMYVRNHKKLLDGWCRLNPQPLQRSCADVCGQVSFYAPRWLDGVHPLRDHQTVVEWAQEQIDVVANDTYRNQRFQALTKENAELRRQLKVTRKRSAARLEKLQKQQKPKPVELICDQAVENQPQTAKIIPIRNVA